MTSTYRFVSRLLRAGTWAACYALASSGCSSAASDFSDAQGSRDADGAPAGDEHTPESLSFDTQGTLRMKPKAQHQLTVVTEPPGGYVVRFALLPGEDNPNDASLDRTQVRTGPDGLATVLLTAPSRPATFQIRASAGTSVSAGLAVSVSSSGFATLEVEPRYKGNRDVEQWVASARAGSTCASLTGTPPPDGDLIATADADSMPRIEGIPVGPSIALTVRAGEFASGCMDVPHVQAGTVKHVTVSVTDRPMQLGQLALDLSFGMAETTPEWQTQIHSWTELTANAARGDASSDTSALLDAMKQESEAPTEFENVRASAEWDAVLVSELGANAEVFISEHLRFWMLSGAERLQGASTFAGALSAATTPGFGSFELDSVAGLPPREAGFTRTSLTTLATEPQDTLLIGGTLYWLPSYLLAALGEQVALEDVPAAPSMGAALAERINCTNVANVLLSATAGGDEAYAGCGTSCLEQLCVAGLDRLWERAKSAPAVDAARLQLSTVVSASVNQQAVPTYLQGTWTGWFGTATAEELLPAGGGELEGTPSGE